MKQAIATLDLVLPLAPARAVSRCLWIAAFALLTAAAARFQVPLLPVPVTLQTTAVLLAGALLGPAAGAASQLLYLALGIAGLPVFAGGGGAGYLLLSPTTGYLLSFPLAAAACGGILHAGWPSALPVWPRALLGTIAGTGLVLWCGVLYLGLTGATAAWSAGAGIFLATESIKVLAAATLAAVLLRTRPSA